MWAVCYGVGGGVLIYGKIVHESNGIVDIEDPNRLGETSGWDADYIEKFESQKAAQEAFEVGYRQKWS
jgi:hypothetical protein